HAHTHTHTHTHTQTHTHPHTHIHTHTCTHKYTLTHAGITLSQIHGYQKVRREAIIPTIRGRHLAFTLMLKGDDETEQHFCPETKHQQTDATPHQTHTHTLSHTHTRTHTRHSHTHTHTHGTLGPFRRLKHSTVALL